MNTSIARQWLQKINAAHNPFTGNAPFNLLNVCGGHERSITQAGLRGVLPDWLKLIPGPGCPVCVCPEADIALAIAIARRENCILLAFGDMLRVSINRQPHKTAIPDTIRSLEQARASGADIRPIASPLSAKEIALENPRKTVVFFAAGFETTMAPVAALIDQTFTAGEPDNLLFLVSGRRTWPAVELLLNDRSSSAIHGLVAPGHVATVMGAQEWQFIPEKHQLPTAVAGFETSSLLQAFYALIQQAHHHEARLENCYTEAVTHQGNTYAQKILQRCFTIGSANWRGIGAIKQSGYHLKNERQALDAQQTFRDLSLEIHESYNVNAMPKSCKCADVVMARKLPNQCPLYGKSCTPRLPVGPCMVSDEGACRIWWSAGV